jgi:23S rRNA pseudouridine2605 synthase
VIRLNKRISSSGFCSRRKAEEYIFAGRVKVNGEVIISPATSVSETDKIAIDDQELGKTPKARLWAYYKPVGLITSYRDMWGRPTIFDNLPEGMPNVISVGRLDLNSEGLLLLTNSGELARFFELPKNKLQRCYEVRAYGRPDMKQLAALAQGIEIDGFNYGKILVQFLQGERTNSWFKVTIFEGKNREIRKVFDYCGLRVNRLIRVGFGPYELGDLQVGEVQELQINQKFLEQCK